MQLISIQALSELTGILPVTIRAWEHRHKALKPLRNKQNNRRLYSYDDVEKVRCLKALLDQGFSIGQIAPLKLHELKSMLYKNDTIQKIEPPRAQHDFYSDEIITCINYLHDYKLNEVERLLNKINLSMPLSDYLIKFITPLFKELGILVDTNKMSIAHEHAFSALLKNHLFNILATIPSTTASQKAVAIAGVEGNYHEFAILISHILCRHYGLNSYNFGPNMPALPLIEAANAMKIKLLMISNSPIPSEFQKFSLKQYIQILDKNAKQPLQLIVGGLAEEKIKCNKIKLSFCHNFEELIQVID